MRIIGGKDYYDGANYGIDNEIVFVRNEEEILFEEKELPIHINHDIGYCSRDNYSKSLNLIYTFFCGNVYPALRIIENKSDLPHVSAFENTFDWSKYAWENHKVNFIYEYDQAKKVVEASDCNHSSHFLRKENKKELYEHFHFNKDLTGWTIENKIVTGYLQRVNNRFLDAKIQDSKVKRKIYLQKWNGDFLNDLQFYKVKDAFSANQEISMFVGGVLPKPGANIVKLDNKERIQKAGFDFKTSFRKM
jgi:hypothetical protein